MGYYSTSKSGAIFTLSYPMAFAQFLINFFYSSHLSHSGPDHI